MNLSKKIDAFVKLGDILTNITESDLSSLIASAKSNNGWFTEKEVKRAFNGLSKMLTRQGLTEWTSNYQLINNSPKKIGVVMAGNIPMVGFHDLLCVLMAGHILEAKLSSQDTVLMTFIIKKLKEIAPSFEINTKERLNDIDAIIATGSDNSARYFEYYFRDKPRIIRKNRTSVAVLSGNETKNQLMELASDIFSYHGLGCRNVSKLYYPESYDLTIFLDSIEDFSEIINHHKYKNNYDYNKSILLVNGVKHLDNGFLLLHESDQMVSPISVLFSESYSDHKNMNQKLSDNDEKIQCVANSELLSDKFVKFGQTQQPAVWDYADGIDTLKFLDRLGD